MHHLTLFTIPHFLKISLPLIWLISISPRSLFPGFSPIYVNSYQSCSLVSSQPTFKSCCSPQNSILSSLPTLHISYLINLVHTYGFEYHIMLKRLQNLFSASIFLFRLRPLLTTFQISPYTSLLRKGLALTWTHYVT